MRVLAACSLGGVGHLHPLLTFLGAARRRGDETLVVAPAPLREMVEGAGYTFLAGGEPPAAEVAAIRERLAVAPAQEASILANRDLFARLATTAMLPGMEQVCAEWQPDLILRDPCEYASAVVAGRRCIPTAQLGISLAEVEGWSITVAAPALEAHREGLVEELRASPYLTRFPASLDPSPFPATVRFRESVASSGEPLPDWWGGSQAPLVYVSFGTVLGHMSIAADVYRTAMRAVDGLDIRVLLTVGRRFDRSSLGSTPANVHIEAWVDQRDVFSQADLVVCHGGSGTAFGALAAGLPVVALPMFSDQFVNGQRIAENGAGVIVEAEQITPGLARNVISESEAPRIADAITTVLSTPSYQREARRIAAEMAAVQDVDQALAALFPNVGVYDVR